MHGTISENQTKSIDPATGQVIDSTPIHLSNRYLLSGSVYLVTSNHKYFQQF